MTEKYESDAGCISWSVMIDRAMAMPDLADRREALIAEARKRLELRLVRRVYRYEDVGKHRTWLDGRAKPLEPAIREIFALAMSDCTTSTTVCHELPLLATALRFTGDTAFQDRIVEQLTEMATWSPIQRPGWTCYYPGAKPPEADRGYNWLATGWGVRAIAMTLQLLPEGCFDADLVERLETLLDAEIESIVEDWRLKRTWFIQNDNTITNQWVLPTEGLVTACLFRGRRPGDEAYELGVKKIFAGH